MPKHDPTDPDPTDPLSQAFDLHVTPGLDDWATRAEEMVGMAYNGARNQRALWALREQWLGLTERKRLDLLQRILDRARTHIDKPPSRPLDRLDSERVLDIFSDLWHAIDHAREPRR